MRTANYRVEYEDETSVTIRDLGPWDEHPTVTNDAERVVRDLHGMGLQCRRLYYYDSGGQLDELLHDGHGEFLGFAVLDRSGSEARS